MQLYGIQQKFKNPIKPQRLQGIKVVKLTWSKKKNKSRFVPEISWHRGKEIRSRILSLQETTGFSFALPNTEAAHQGEFYAMTNSQKLLPLSLAFPSGF